MGELGRLLLVSGGNVTVVVDGLEAEGLVTRSNSAMDRRSYCVALTKLGSAEFEHIATSHEAEIDRLFANVSERDLATLNAIFKRMMKETP